MPLFNRHSVDEPTHTTSPRTSSTTHGFSASPTTKHSPGLFSRRRSPSPVSTTPSTTSHRTSLSVGGGGGSKLFKRGEDTSIVAARERVARAETMEREADQALIQARAAVKEAREHVRALEKEAEAEAKAAARKQEAARGISKRTGLLGRHDRA